MINWIPLLAGGILVVTLLTALRRPLRWALGLAARTGIGMAVLAALGLSREILGLELGVNLWNALVLGILGAPGLGLLAMTQWILR